MNFSVPNAETRAACELTTPLAWLIRDPFIRQLMRIGVIFIAIVLATLQVLMATPGHGQSTTTTVISLELKDESLISALKKIEHLTSYRFVYRNEEIRDIEGLSMPGAKRTVHETLELLLDNTAFTYREMKKNILIVRRETTTRDAVQPAAVDHAVSGRVADAEGVNLAGVSVVLKGTTTGTATDADGRYSLTVPSGDGVLTFSFIGYKTEEVSIDNRTAIDIVLQPDVQSLTEVVVTALGITRQEKSLGYSTQEVKGQNITFTKEQNVLGSLSGKVAGLQVIGSPGASMGGTQKLKIRGINFLDGTGDPLVVLDGTPMSNRNFSERNGQDYGNVIQDLNPDDIESINVLKGPTASALYGLRGQNGVIMITTKKGARGAKVVNVEYSGAYSVEKAGNFMPNQNLYGGGSVQRFDEMPDGTPVANMSVDESWGPKMDGTPVRQFYSFYPDDPDYGKLTPYVAHPDNIKDFYETGSTVNNNISVSGGAANSSFRLSYNRTTIQGVTPNTWLKRNNVGFNGSLDIVPKLTVSTSLNYANNKGQRPPQGYDYGTTYFNQWFQRSIDMKKLRNYKYPDGSFLHWNLDDPDSDDGSVSREPLYWNNPYFDAYESYSNDSRDRYFGNVSLAYQVLPYLRLTGTVRTDQYTQNIDNRVAAGGRFTSEYYVAKYQNKEYNYEFLANLNKEFGKFSLNATVGANLMNQQYTYLTQRTVGGLTAPGFYNINASIDRPEVKSFESEKEIRSMFGVVSLGYKNTYFVDASLRNDNTSTLQPGNNSYWYPSVAASVNFSDWFNWQPMNLGKLRASYAVAGQDVATYITSINYEVGLPYGSVNSLYVPDLLNNPDLKPSFSKSLEGGIDLKFFNNRLGASFTLYLQRNRNQILELPVSGASGYSEAYINAGLIENKGFELALTGSPVRTNKFSWDISFNIARNRSMVKELYSSGGIDINNYMIASNTYASRTVSVNARVGEPYGTLIGNAYKRDPATGKILLNANNVPIPEANHNFGSVLPDYTGGLQNTFSYGPLTLNAMIDYQFGGQFFSWTRMLSVKSGQAVETAAMNDRGHNVRDPLAEGGGVKVEGISSVTGEPVSTYADAKAYYRNSLGRDIYEEWLYDASFIRLREVRLAYTFNKAMFEKLPFKSASVALIARNPLMIWQKAPKGLNPAELANGSEPVSWLETGQLTTVRSYGVSLNLAF